VSVLLTACPQKYTIELSSDGASGDPSFRFRSGLFGNGGAALDGIEVRRCPSGTADSGEVVWAVSYSGRADVKTVRYGRTPEGFSHVVEPKQLEAGCYIVHDPVDHQPFKFFVKRNGQVEAEVMKAQTPRNIREHRWA
jgi:hypothetical protein